jgi:hypothetical protein
MEIRTKHRIGSADIVSDAVVRAAPALLPAHGGRLYYVVGRTPSSAADALVGLLTRVSPAPGEGAHRGSVDPPHRRQTWSKQ